ncbi:MAG: DUF4230 domain-containing protein [Nitrosomonas sp.]|nr:DUF4230 domain-containing protein [Nitrosomonas sp.]
MTELYLLLAAAMIGAVLGLLLAVLVIPKILRKKEPSVSLHSTLQRIREMGDLVALNGHVRTVVTRTSDPGFAFTIEKMILICEFDVEYRFNLRKAIVAREPKDGTVTIELQPVKTEVALRDFETYDETSGRLLGIIPISSSSKDKDALRKAAIAKAKEDAKQLGVSLQENIQTSTERTLQALCSNITDAPVKVIFDLVK